MRDFIMLCSALIVSTALGSSVFGCLNDQELPQREREFRSHYLVEETPLNTAVPQKSPSFAWAYPISAVLFLGAGGLIWLSSRQ